MKNKPCCAGVRNRGMNGRDYTPYFLREGSISHRIFSSLRLVYEAKVRYTILLLIGFSGCGASYPKRYHYQALDFNIIVASPEEVNAHCKKYATHNDLGEPITKDSPRIRCCYKFPSFNGRGTMFVSNMDLDCIFHELCHVEGRPSKECHKVKY